MDIWNKKKRSEVMAKIRSTNTKPEMLVRKFLFSKGLRYRINYKKLPGKPDIVFSKYKTAIFINGCFWHGHENCKISHIPKTNSTFWKNKIEKNKIRDYNNIQDNLLLGWSIIIIWECEIKPQNLEKLYDKVKEVLDSKNNSFFKIKLYDIVSENVSKIKEDIVEYKKK
ncbi:very short patch repair endonuclease [Chryseobacterium sp. 2987]|uniref:very short patch repair endonuclease n=1 Tax=Chryseobacterium sp. 2987 TaxID=2817767 RepID=UPI002855A8D9|nr:very short patch repair endonuclease [Chryseobacterium sp. 2987]MDR6919587.1 DNA mismatch endonuclease (patch repair protein) [Chryseobacterium sp. 2987]